MRRIRAGLVNNDVAEQAARLRQPTLPGTITPKSWLGVPMMVGDQATGILILYDQMGNRRYPGRYHLAVNGTAIWFLFALVFGGLLVGLSNL